MTLGLGRYRLCQHNVWHTLSSRVEFHLFSKRSKHCQNNLHFQLKLSFIDHAANIFGPRSVSQAKSILFSGFCHIHGTWVPQKILNAYAKLDQLPKLASACVVTCLRFHSCQKMNYTLLKFLSTFLRLLQCLFAIYTRGTISAFFVKMSIIYKNKHN